MHVIHLNLGDASGSSASLEALEERVPVAGAAAYHEGFERLGGGEERDEEASIVEILDAEALQALVVGWVQGQGHILRVELAEALEGEILKRRAVGDERNETGGAETAGGEGELGEERRAVEGEGVETVVGDIDAALELELLEGGQKRGDPRQRLVVDAHNLPRTLQRKNRNGAEPRQQRREGG